MAKRIESEVAPVINRLTKGWEPNDRPETGSIINDSAELAVFIAE